MNDTAMDGATINDATTDEMMMDEVIFREYDIRGIPGKNFDNKFARNLGRAITTFVARDQNVETPGISISFDARHSSPHLAKAISQGVVESGGTAIQLGLSTTPMNYYSLFTLENVHGGVMITGSHNPKEYNGFKVSSGQTTLFGQNIQLLKELILQRDFISGQGSISQHNIFDHYVERYKREFGILNNIPLVLDCGNGTAGCIARRLYEAIGLKPHILFETPDGDFPNHHPDPTVAENLAALQAKVKETNSLIGIGFDGDSDRIGLVDDTGRIICGDEFMAICSRSILKDHPGQKIIGDVKCSDELYNDIQKQGGIPIMWKTGHSLIKEKIRREKAPFGGELSGHIFFADRNYGYDDALYAGLRIVEILSKTGKTIGELLEGLPKVYNTPEIRIDTTEEKKHSIVEKLKSKFSTNSDEYSINTIDGIRVSFHGCGWALARASHTQPVLVLRFEANTEENLKKIQECFEDTIKPLLG